MQFMCLSMMMANMKLLVMLRVILFKECLTYVSYTRAELLEQIRVAVEGAVRNKRMCLQEGRKILRHYEDSLNGYTYLGNYNLGFAL